MLSRFLFAFSLFTLTGSTFAADWKPAPAPLMTKWGKKVTPENAWQEYPRPQMVRKDWLNLNGLWDYAITAKGAAQAREVGRANPRAVLRSSRRCPASASTSTRIRTSGIAATFAVPAGWKGKRVLLHFGAVDWEATVFVNGKELGTHRGGYDPFTLRHHRRPEGRARTNSSSASGTRPTPARSRAASRCASPAASGTRRSPASGRRCGWSRCRETHIDRVRRFTPDVDKGEVESV